MTVRRGKELVAALIAAATIASPVSAAPAAPAAPTADETLLVERFGLYVAVDDVERSVAFYQALFGEAPQVRTPALVGFDIAGGLFGIVDRAAYAPRTTAKGGVRPFIKVADIAAAFARVDRLAPGRIEAPGIVTEGAFRFFRFADPDGNVLEFFSMTPPP